MAVMTSYYYGDINSFSDNINLFFTPIIVYHYSNIDLSLQQYRFTITPMTIFYRGGFNFLFHE